MRGALFALSLTMTLGLPAQAAPDLPTGRDRALAEFERVYGPTPPCKMNESEQTLAAMLLVDERQQRTHLRCNPKLAKAARAKARDMAERGYFAHVTPDGVGPNKAVRQAGYDLPDGYGIAWSNQVESIGAGYEQVELLWADWLDSSVHRTHLLAEDDFFEEQYEYGVGYYHDPDSEYGDYWVVLTARPEVRRSRAR